MLREGTDIVGGKIVSYIQDEEKGGCKIPLYLHVDENGYIQCYRNGKMTRLHRVALEDKLGIKLSSNIHACHICHTRKCFNKEHLELGTALHNAYQKIEAGRQRYGENIPNSKLTEKKVIAILKSNLSIKDLGSHYKVSATTIRRIKQGILWPETYKELFGHYSEKRIAIRNKKHLQDLTGSKINSCERKAA